MDYIKMVTMNIDCINLSYNIDYNFYCKKTWVWKITLNEKKKSEILWMTKLKNRCNIINKRKKKLAQISTKILEEDIPRASNRSKHLQTLNICKASKEEGEE